MSKTIDYYNQNADVFYENTVSVNMSAQYEMFEKHLFPGARILDCGCGSGRDTKYFLEQGYDVVAIDGSEELCKRASELTGISVQEMRFQDVEFDQEFDGVWACASLLHLSMSELPDVLRRVAASMKKGGVLYTSFKYGEFHGERNGREFTDLNEDALAKIIGDVPGMTLLETCLSRDARPEREEHWLNAICVKA